MFPSHDRLKKTMFMKGINLTNPKLELTKFIYSQFKKGCYAGSGKLKIKGKNGFKKYLLIHSTTFIDMEPYKRANSGFIHQPTLCNVMIARS